MIRLQENVPEIYVDKSRDFQLLCRVYDVINNATRYNIESVEYILDPILCSDRLLPLLATRVGFFPKKQYNSHALRMVISSFPEMMKYKGTKKAVEIALFTILKAENQFSGTETTLEIDSANSIVTVYLSIEDTHVALLRNETLFRDVLSYILPIGYEVMLALTPIDSIHRTTTIADISAMSGKYGTADTSNILTSAVISNQYDNDASQLEIDSVDTLESTQIQETEEGE